MKNSSKFAWFVEEVNLVQWKGFFSFKRDFSDSARLAVERRFGTLPEDYTQFLSDFGESRLFRKLQARYYYMAVFSNPQIRRGKNDELLLEIGFYMNGGYAYLKKSDDKAGVDHGVFECVGMQLRKVSDSFAEWLKKRFVSAKKLYKKSEWKRISEGAAPFSDEERRLVSAIELFSFERVGIANNGDMQIRVSNASKLRLPYLTVGAKTLGQLEGAVFLDVSGIGPGETKVLTHDCYKSSVAADKIELYSLPLPEPEDREAYREFAAPSWLGKPN
jgi:hypothetical protein